MNGEDKARPATPALPESGSPAAAIPPALPAAPPTRAATGTDGRRAEGLLVRGLSALFWGLPVALVVCVQTARTHFFAPLGIVPPLVVNGLLLYALTLMGRFKPEHAQWQRALEYARLLALVNLGLSPFLYWWKLMPEVPHYQLSVGIMALSGLLFLFCLNRVVQRLGDLVQDDYLRAETRLFAAFNLYVLTGIFVAVACWPLLRQWQQPPLWLASTVRFLQNTSIVLLLFAVLLPTAVTMALLWRLKETVLSRFFGCPGA